MEPIILLAQGIGLIGYFLYVYAPRYACVQKMIRTDILACCFIMVQWGMLGAPALMIVNFISIIVSLICLSRIHPRMKDHLILLMYPVSLIVLLSQSSALTQPAVIDLCALCALCCTITSRRIQSIVGFRTCGVIAGFVLMLSGALSGSTPAVLFNAFFCAGHLQKLGEILWERHGKRRFREKILQNPA